jgi:hypothetical protein
MTSFIPLGLGLLAARGNNKRRKRRRRNRGSGSLFDNHRLHMIKMYAGITLYAGITIDLNGQPSIAYTHPSPISIHVQPRPPLMPVSSLEVGRVDNGRAGDGVLAEAVAPDVDENAGVRGTVRARDLDTSRQLASLAASNPDLLIVGREWSAWKHRIPTQTTM